MPLLASESIHIPTKDVLTWCYDNRANFDQDKPIYIDCAKPSRSISANQAYSLIRKLIAGLRAAGLKKGDVVCIHAFNNLYYPILVQGIVGAGAAFIGTNPNYTTYELDHALKVSKAKFIITEPEVLKVPQETARQRGLPKNRMLLLAEPDDAAKYGYASWRTLLEHGEKDWERFDDIETAKNTPAFLMLSSGTTGLPKAAAQSHYNYIAEHTLVHENPKRPEPYHLSRLICLPMFHTSVAPYVFTTTLRSGRESYIMKRFALPEYLHYHEQFKITSIMVVPPMVVALVQAAARDEGFVRKCLAHTKQVIAGGAPLDAATQAKLQASLPTEARFTQIWAMTEISCIACYLYYPESDDTGSVGRFMPNLDVKLVDPENGDREVGLYDERGELCIRGPTVIQGYVDNPEANARDWDEDGYFHTGDIAYCDGKTKLWYIVDRKKELIKARGFQVAPSEIEGVLISHPKIKDAAVIGIPDERGQDELSRAYVVVDPQDQADVTEDVVKRWITDRLAKYKQLSGGVKFVSSIPKTASGKILKRHLREEARKENDGRAKL